MCRSIAALLAVIMLFTHTINFEVIFSQSRLGSRFITYVSRAELGECLKLYHDQMAS
jgi:hypothetical protein